MDEDDWHVPYLDSDLRPADPWRSACRHRAPGERRKEFDLGSPGPDRQDNAADDIGNWTDQKGNS